MSLIMIHVFTVLTCHLLAENGIARHKKVTLSVKKCLYTHSNMTLFHCPVNQSGMALQWRHHWLLFVVDGKDK